MIDVKLICSAKKKSDVIETIDSSWRSYVKSLRSNIFTIPFKGEYAALIETNFVLIEGYSGELIIDKLYYHHKTYLLKSPVRHSPFSIYGAYDSKGGFENFVARPEIGFHYLGMSNYGHAICTGDIQYVMPDSLGALKEASLKIIDSFRLINMESMGTVLLPAEHSRLRDILSDNEVTSETKLKRLLAEGLIEEIL